MAKLYSACVKTCKYRDDGHCVGCSMTKAQKKISKKLKSKDININSLNNLDLKTIELKRLPMVKLLNFLPPQQSLFETVIVSANDTLVELFLNNKIEFIDIQKKLFKIINKKKFLKFKNKYPKKIQDILKLNNYVRLKTLENSI